MRLLKRRFSCLFIFLWLLQSCSVVDYLGINSQYRVTKLLEEHRYMKVLAIAERQIHRSSDPAQQQHWQQLQADTMQRADAFMQSEIEAIDVLREEQDWFEANRRTQFLLDNVPGSEVLQTYLNGYSDQKQRYLDELTRELLVFESEHLPQSLALLEKLYQADAGNSLYRKLLNREQARREQVIEDLYEKIAQLEAEKKYYTSLVLAKALQRLEDSAQLQARIDQFRQFVDARNAQRDASDGELSKEQKQLLHNYGVALVAEQWLQARAILDDLLRERPHDGELLGQDTYLKEVFAEEVAEAITEGEQKYSSGNIEEALALWREVVPMAADNVQLQANIERAQRILDKVKALKSDEIAPGQAVQPESAEEPGPKGAEPASLP